VHVGRANATLRPCRFPCAFPGRRVRLAKQTNSLVRFSKRTTEHRLPVVPTAGSHPGRFPRDLLCPVAPSPPDFRLYCTSLQRVLFSVRSRYLFAIGLGECLALAVDACRIHKGFPTLATPVLAHTVVAVDTGLSPCFALRSRRLLDGVRVLHASPHTTLPVGSLSRPAGLRFELCRVHPQLLTTSQLRFLFLPVLRCFSSRRSPLREAIAVGIPIRKSRVLPLRAGPPGLSQLGTSFVGFRAEPFTRRHSSHCGDSVKRVQWTPGSHVHTVSSTRPRRGACIDPSHPRSHGMVHRSSVTGSNAFTHLRSVDSNRPG
jgi:hypothetical protein